MVVPGMTVSLGQQIIIDNRPGGIMQGEIVRKAQADGYTLLSVGNAFVLGPLLTPTPYDPVRDFAPISILARYPNVVIVHPTVAANTIKELIALAKAKPGGLNYASGPVGASNHLAAELFKSMAGVNIVRVAYKGGGPALNDVIAGQVPLVFASTGSVMSLLKSGRLKALATGSAEPSALTPGLPTLAASGVPGYESVQAVAIFAPVRTPTMLVERLNREIVLVLNATEVRSRLANVGVEIVASSPAMLAVKMKSEMVRLGKVIKDAGIRVE
jgi:tripartite-type tricarboxylate transporter receptor subunit TctC